MVRRRWQLDPELAPVAGERLRRLLGRDPDPPDWMDDDPVPRRGVPSGRLAQAVPDDPIPVGLADLAPPRRFTRWHLGVVAGLVLIGLLWGGWSLLRARPVALAAPASVQTAAVPSASAAPTASSTAALSSTTSPSAAVQLVVHVLGAVHRPGLVRLPEHARVQDAIDRAGGLTRDADPGELNLAQLLADGEQVVIGTRQHAAGEVRGAGSTGGGDTSGSSLGSGSTSAGDGVAVDLNQATEAQLEQLPGVGPVTAQKILDWRQQHGRFSRAEELQEVSGIGPKTYARLAPHVRV